MRLRAWEVFVVFLAAVIVLYVLSYLYPEVFL